MQLNYTLTGTVEVPEGSTLNPTSTGIILPDGTSLKLWESWEREASEDEFADLSYDDLVALGIHYDGDMTCFEITEA